jgi:hypothetical protein
MLKLHAGVSKKVGLPGFSSASASCTIEAELDSSLLQDREGFQIVVQRAYQSCEQAVQDQIAWLTNDGQSDDSQPNTQPQEVIEGRTGPAIRGVTVTASGTETLTTNLAVFRAPPALVPLPPVRSKPSGLSLLAGRSTLWGRFGNASASPRQTNSASGRRVISSMN